ncbi:MAG: hypothetical protein EZS28_018945, partial [Streblomastix strix]
TLSRIGYHKITLPPFILRALIKQILEGINVFHKIGFIHRDIKCDNILLHSPPGSGRVYAKISDFGFSMKDGDITKEHTYRDGTAYYMAPEILRKKNIKITQKVDIYAVGITFYYIIMHEFPQIDDNNDKFPHFSRKTKAIKKPAEIKDDILWDLLSKLLKFKRKKRITAEQALQHPYFTSPEAEAQISPQQKELANSAKDAQSEGDKNITEYDINPSFIVAESAIKEYLEESDKAEQQLKLLDMTLEQISGGLKNINQLSLLDRDVLFVNLIKRFEFGKEIIDFLKETIHIQDQYDASVQLQSLQFLAESQQNHELILSGGFLNELNNFLIDDKKVFTYIGVVTLFVKLFKFGTPETKEQIWKTISKDRVKILADYGNDDDTQKSKSRLIKKNHYENVIVIAGELYRLLIEYENNEQQGPEKNQQEGDKQIKTENKQKDQQKEEEIKEELNEKQMEKVQQQGDEQKEQQQLKQGNDKKYKTQVYQILEQDGK